MKSLYKLPELDRGEDKKLNFYLIIALVGAILIVISFVLMIINYNKALDKCVDLNDNREYCEIMLN